MALVLLKLQHKLGRVQLLHGLHELFQAVRGNSKQLHAVPESAGIALHHRDDCRLVHGLLEIVSLQVGTAQHLLQDLNLRRTSRVEVSHNGLRHAILVDVAVNKQAVQGISKLGVEQHIRQQGIRLDRRDDLQALLDTSVEDPRLQEQLELSLQDPVAADAKVQLEVVRPGMAQEPPLVHPSHLQLELGRPGSVQAVHVVPNRRNKIHGQLPTVVAVHEHPCNAAHVHAVLGIPAKGSDVHGKPEHKLGSSRPAHDVGLEFFVALANVFQGILRLIRGDFVVDRADVEDISRESRAGSAESLFDAVDFDDDVGLIENAKVVNAQLHNVGVHLRPSLHAIRLLGC